MTLYIETNFLVGAAFGRDPDVEDLLLIPAESLQIAIPAICVMEAWSVFEREQTRRRAFKQDLDRHINEARRDLTSLHARSLRSHLEQARIDDDNLLNDVGRRLRETLAKLSRQLPGYNPVELISLTPRALASSLAMREMDEPTDALILAAILDHAASNSIQEGVLVTGNSKDFDTPDVRSLLTSAGIDRYFPSTGTFLDWFHSLPPPAIKPGR